MQKNLPNQITVFRFFIIPFILIFISFYPAEKGDSIWILLSYIFSLLLFILATVSDYLDGYYARKYNLTSEFGKLFDPLADKILTSSLFVLFTHFDLLSPYIVIIILAREFLISGLRSFAAIHNQVLGANRWGKHKTGWQIALIICIYLEIIHSELIKFFPLQNNIVYLIFGDLTFIAHYFILTVVLFLTIFSSYIYISANKHLLKNILES